MFEDFTLFTHLILPMLIFIARICDVTLGTIRIIFVSKGYRNLAPLVGFFEVLIWVIVISQLLSKFSSWICYIAYAGGFAAGNFVGMIIEERIAIGLLLVRITTQKDGHEVLSLLNRMGFGATLTFGEGSTGEVSIVQSIVSRKSIKNIQTALEEYDPKLFYSIEDIRSVTHGIFPAAKNPWMRWRSGK
ncbi:MAG: DUF2179 domain-containing protein [Prevotellaceae bacterium]|jgi:uncharacterized protein YebE (UPF0316 family)|nr:DUF2179 domain-containing protein [Prevotellaceae bacterium]